MKNCVVMLVLMLAPVLRVNADIDLITVSSSSQKTNAALANLFHVSINPRNAFQGDRIHHVHVDFVSKAKSPKSLGLLMLDGDTPLVTASISPQVLPDGMVRFTLDLHSTMLSKCFLDYLEDETDPDVKVAMGTIYRIDVGSYYKVPATPAGVVSNFIREVSALATRHTELADFPEYVKRLEAQSQVEFKKDIKPFAVSFDKNTTPVLTKRRIRPSDCGTNGIFLQFVLDDGTNERQAPSDTVTYYPNLKLTLYAEVVLWEKASPELKKKLEDMVAGHKAMLSELDKATANKPHAGDGK